VLGLPLWGALPPQQRVALLGHELGHLVNGDPRRGLLVQPAYRTLGQLANLFRPVRYAGVNALAEFLARQVMRVLARLAWLGQLLLITVGQRDAQRAEYLADQVAARVAGSSAAAGVLRSLLLGEGMRLAVVRAVRTGEPARTWRDAAEASRTALAGDLPARTQLSIRDEVSLFAGHPPKGLRVRMIEARPFHQPTVVLTDAEAARIDEELAPFYEKSRRALALMSV
jgi:heat shock protein HtpX